MMRSQKAYKRWRDEKRHVRYWNKRRHRFKRLTPKQFEEISFWLKASSHKKHPAPFNKRRAGWTRRAERLFAINTDRDTLGHWDAPRPRHLGRDFHWRRQKGSSMFFWQPEWMPTEQELYGNDTWHMLNELYHRKEML